MINEGDLTLSILIASSTLTLSLLSQKNGFILVNNTLNAILFDHFDDCSIRGFSTVAWQIFDSFLDVLCLSTIGCQSGRYSPVLIGFDEARFQGCLLELSLLCRLLCRLQL